jgi:S-(hydroxymethyl)glutathione dehydrogenase/alcohol dehydrogenase
MRRTVTSESRLVAIPAEMPLLPAALLGCAVPTGAGIVLNSADVREGSTVAVFGAGGLGLSAILAASTLRKAGRVIAVDVSARKLEQARAAGATDLIDASSEDPVAKILALTGGRGTDYAIETAGRRETMEAAHRSVRGAGGLCVIAGNLPFGEKIAIDPMDLIKGKRIVGTWGGETDLDRDIPRYAGWYADGTLRGKLDAMVTHRFPLERVNEAFDALEAGEVGRAIIDLSSHGPYP